MSFIHWSRYGNKIKLCQSHLLNSILKNKIKKMKKVQAHAALLISGPQMFAICLVYSIYKWDHISLTNPQCRTPVQQPTLEIFGAHNVL